MRVFMTLAADNVTPAGFYPDDIHDEPPADAVEITAEQWADAVANQGLRRWNAATSAFDTCVPPLGPPPVRRASAKQIRYALSDLGVRDAWEAAAGPGKATQAVQDWWGWTDPIAEDAAKLGRLCKAVGITPAALLDKAVSE